MERWNEAGESSQRDCCHGFIRKPCLYLLLCIPVVGWLILLILYLRRSRVKENGEGDRNGSCFHPYEHTSISPITYGQGISDSCKKSNPGILYQSFKGSSYFLDYPLQLLSVAVVGTSCSSDAERYERYLKLLVANDSCEPISYCEWKIVSVCGEDGRNIPITINSLRFFDDIPAWGSVVLESDVPLPPDTLDVDLRLQLVMTSPSYRTVVFDSFSRTLYRCLPQRLASLYPITFVERYASSLSFPLAPYYMYEEHSEEGYGYSHCPFCGRFNPIQNTECRCCHAPLELQRRLSKISLDSACASYLSHRQNGRKRFPFA